MFTLFYEPRPFWSLLVDSFRLYKTVFFRVVVLSILTGLFIFSPIIFLGSHVDGTFIKWDILAISFFSQLVGLWLSFVILYRINQIMLQSYEDGYSRAFWVTLKKIPIWLSASVIGWVISVFGFSLLFLPGLYLYILFSFVVLGILFDNDGVLMAFKHSARLVCHHWWRLFGFFIMTIIIFSLVAAAILAGINTVAIFLPQGAVANGAVGVIPWFFSQIRYIVVGLTIIVTLPWVMSLLVLQYYDLKLRYRLRRKGEKA